MVDSPRGVGVTKLHINVAQGVSEVLGMMARSGRGIMRKGTF